ncbi:mechanosensitive ion channel [Nisaea acidiphila]|uniref:Small-conductance mechanosensitive channel n=1 Tax=Nisaea acidiphila TaxID=1862145 RepID=A0A9J7AVU8_9PROT|nr:mechanosensitive ion channel domain-containing protein [Nisaea acidiphila]UUX51907.1 mechanosensitive ion channel [Nisaea acidiphila]
MNIDVAGEVNVLWEEAQLILATYGFDVLGAILILLLGWIIAGWASSATRSAVERIAWMDGTVKPLIASIVRYLVIVITVVAVLNRFGVQTTSIIAVLGAAGLAVGLALQGTLSNVAAGVMILFLRPFKVGDYVTAGGNGGTVAEVGLFTTELTTPDNVYISVPNSQIIGGAISNFSRHSTRRIDIVVGIGYSSNIDTAFAALMKLAEEDGRVLADPEPQVSVRELADSSVNVGLRFWVNSVDYWPTLFDFNKAVKETLDANGVEIPFPQRVVEIKNPQ